MKEGMVEKGDFIVLTPANRWATSGGTNTLKIVRVGEKKAPAA
jgi:pyruvate kinase